jgi:hypothetical protein
MADYEPLDLSSLCNAGLDVLERPGPRLIGEQTFHGLPFLVGGPNADPARCFLGFGRGLREAPFEVPVGRLARTVIVAHRQVESDMIEKAAPIGGPVADYVFHLANGESVRVPIRERFEISIIPTSVWSEPIIPFDAVYDARPRLYPRAGGSWDAAARRPEEILPAFPQAYYLWTWVNPQPEVEVTSLQVVPAGLRFLVAGITLGHLDEYPFMRRAAREVRISLPQPEDAARKGYLEVEIDRGEASYAFSLPEAPAEAFLADRTYHGWGEAQNPKAAPAYTLVAGIPSATLTVKHDGETLGSVRWGDVEAQGSVDTPRLRVEVVDRGRNWVRTSVLDDATGEPIPCRVHFRSPDGIPYQPHGHHAHVNSNFESHNVNIGGDLRLGQITYAYINGRCEGWLPRGEVIVDLARGFEYEPLRTRVTIEPGQQELTLRLKRWRDMNAERWFSGDTHVHFLSTQGGHLEARGEDLNVVNLLQAQWGHLFTSIDEFTGGPNVSPDGRTIVYVSQEQRQHFLGHLILLGLKEPVMPWASDGPGESEMGGSLEVTLSEWADRTHAQGGTVVVPHFPVPNGESSALIATGRVDAVEMHRHNLYRHLEYYRYLNAGYRLPLTGGTDKMTADLALGMYRTYVSIPADQPFTYDAWCRNLALGRSYVSSGALLDFTVEGAGLGDTVRLPAGGGEVEVHAHAGSIFPIHTLEIVQQGRVVASTHEPNGARSLHLTAKVRVDGHSWLAARVGGPDYGRPLPHHDGTGGRGIFAHTSPIYVACGGEWDLLDPEAARHMLTLYEGMLTYIRKSALQHPPGTITHHHGEHDHQAYLERPYLQARDAVQRRLDRLAGH